ncbi:hypothetical protein VTJ49DRAFT_1746 [Mycothermus thermophilus]|uniref:Uncharacterized protein n=1 Tax=Humicola insolens TaxID=85995 RepID=A0ABR3VNK1_HUMIN
MASFSRGFAPRLLLVVQQQPPCQCAALHARQLLQRQVLVARFSTSPFRRLKKPPRPTTRPQASTAPEAAPKLAPKPASPTVTASGPTAKPAPRAPPSYAEQLAQRGRTLLYESPSHFWYRAGCFSSATFCVSYTVYQYWAVMLHPPEGLSWWIPHAFSVILVFMAGMGGYFALGAGRIVRSIEAVPAAAVAKQIASKVGTSATSPPPPIYIEVATRRVVPFMPPKKTLLAPSEVQLPFRMHSLFSGANAPGAQQATKHMTLAERVRAERAEREAREARRKYTMDHLLTAPFRDAARVFGAAWTGVKRSFHREGFARIRLGKREYKLDVMGGWALDDGRAMDRLLAVRPNALRSAR